MKKNTFYSIMFKDGKKQAVKHEGYTDGTYNYYKSFTTWYAILPSVGLSVATDCTRKAAQAKANAPEMLEAIKRRMQERGEALKADFQKFITEAKTI